MSAANQPWAEMATAEFLAWNPQDGARWKLTDGGPRAVAPAHFRHLLVDEEIAEQVQSSSPLTGPVVSQVRIY